MRRGWAAGAWLVACATWLSCGPTIPPCSPESCAEGCCDSAGVCVAGRSVHACGAGGQVCAVCQAGEQCADAACEPLPVDAGSDAGADAGDDAGVDGGTDAGRLRTVTIVRVFEALQPDGGVTSAASDIGGASVSLFVEDGRGQWLTLAGQNSGTSVRFDGVPDGPYAVSFRNGSGALLATFVSDLDDVNIGPKVLGRRSAGYGPTNILFDAGLAVPWQVGDTLATTSFAAGMAKDTFSTVRSADASVLGAGDLSSSSFPYVVGAGDDLTVTLNRQSSDGGGTVVSAAYLGATMPSPDLPSGRTTVFGTPPLAELPRDQATVLLRVSDYTQFVADVNPAATASAQRLLVSATPSGAGVDGGGDFDGRSAALLSVARSGTGDLDDTFSWGNPWGAAAPVTVFRASSSAVVALSFQGRALNRTIDALVTTQVGSGSVSLGPRLSPPRFVRLNGETAFVNRNGVSTTPVLEWAPPALGTATGYSVSFWRVSVSGSNLVQQFVTTVVTPWPRLHVPPGVLLGGEAYFAFITASHVANNDARRTPYRTSRDTDDAVAMTNVFTP